MRVHEPADRPPGLVEGLGRLALEPLLQVRAQEVARDQRVARLALLLEPLDPGTDIILQVSERLGPAIARLFLQE